MSPARRVRVALCRFTIKNMGTGVVYLTPGPLSMQRRGGDKRRYKSPLRVWDRMHSIRGIIGVRLLSLAYLTKRFAGADARQLASPLAPLHDMERGKGAGVKG